MSASGFTPIQLYRSSTAAAVPLAADLAAGELAINTTDEKLYFENASGVVKLLASSAAAGGTFTTVTATTVVNGLGAVGTPSYTFTGDLNTGMWSPAADTIAFSEGGVEAMRISSSGDVGIGTSAPSAKLDVAAAAFTGGPLIGARYNTTNLRMGIGIANANGFPFVGVNVNNAADDNGTFDINARAARLRMDSGTFQFETSSVSGTAGNAITWNTSAYLDTSGNLGIGTTAPSARLSLSSFSDGVFATIGYGGGSYAGIGGTLSNGGGNTTGTLQFHTRTATGDASLSEKMRINSNGNVGIGLSAPTSKLEIYGGVAGTATFATIGNATTAALFGVGTGNDVQIRTAQAVPINFYTSATERMRVDSSGNVGIGTSTPSDKLEVLGSISARGNGITSAISWADIAIFGSFTNHGAGFYTNSTEKMRITTAGELLVGGTTAIFPAAGRGTIDINGSGSVVLGLGVGGTSAGYLFHDATDMSLFQQRNGMMAFGTNGTERMRVTAIGDLLVGTTSSAGRVTLGNNTGGVNGFSAIQSVAGGYNFSSNATSNGGTYYHVVFLQSSVTVGSITSSGSTTAYNTSSDYRLKDIDGPIANSGAYIDALKPVQGSWKADGGRFIGLLAHEVQEVSETRIATGEKDGKEMQAMDYSAPELVANLIAEVQSLRARVAQLEGNQP